MATDSDNTSPMNDYAASGEASDASGNQELTPLKLYLPDPDAVVIALSPNTLLGTIRYICEICHKGFLRDQNLQLHRRGHNLLGNLAKTVYICPEENCVHHDPSRAFEDFNGLKKHFCSKHVEKKWKCDKCSKKYALQSDLNAHSKTICSTKEYKCDCGTLFSRRDSFIAHRAFCDLLGQESARIPLISALPILPSADEEPEIQNVALWMPLAEHAALPASSQSVLRLSTLASASPGISAGGDPNSGLSAVKTSISDGLDISLTEDISEDLTRANMKG